MLLESVLYIDPQALPGIPCPVCRRECYAPSYSCIRCERGKP